jgi:predicted dehydrogenase
MIRIGLLGCGTVAGYGHLPAIVATSGLQLAALVDPNRKNLDAAGEKFGVPPEQRFTDAAQMFERARPDAITVATPAPMHFENVMAAAEHRCHVFCEKPLAETEEEGQKMIDAMRRADRRLVLGFIYRFSEMATRMRNAIREREIGDVRSLRLVYIWDCHGKYVRTQRPRAMRGARRMLGMYEGPLLNNDAPKMLNERRARFMREGGPVIDCGVHQIDLARWWLSSEVIRFSGHGTRIDADHDCPDHVYIHMTHANGVHTMVESSYSYGATCREQQIRYQFEAIGTDGVIRFDHTAKRFELARPTGTTRFDYTPEKNFNSMYAQFVRACETGDTGELATGEDGLIATRIAREAAGQVSW